MMFYGEIVPLPPGVAAAAQRRLINGEQVIVRVVSQELVERLTRQGRSADVLKLIEKTVNALDATPDEGSALTIQTIERLAS
jgi:hypothetical protein